MKERTALGEAILMHWREHCPQMVRDLEKSNRLNRAVFEAQERTGELLHELTVVRKMDYQAAWELAAQEWALPPEETGNRKTAARKPRTEQPQTRKSGPPPSRTSKSETSTRSRKQRPRRGTSG